jgi:DNA-binding protein H-NS
MNVYRVYVENEDKEESWTVGAGSTPAAIGKIIRRTKNTHARKLNVTCMLIAKNIEYKTWKGQQAQAQ